MKKMLLLAACIALLTTDANAQSVLSISDTAAVRRAVLDYVEGFYEGDTTKLVRSIAPNVFKYGYARRAEGYAGMQMQFPSGFIGFAKGVQAGRNLPPANAPKDIVLFDVQDQTASAKLTAWWGIDYLLLAKENGKWMITHVLWQTPPPKADR
jgi:opacity protein-like surface antigen